MSFDATTCSEAQISHSSSTQNDSCASLLWVLLKPHNTGSTDEPSSSTTANLPRWTSLPDTSGEAIGRCCIGDSLLVGRAYKQGDQVKMHVCSGTKHACYDVADIRDIEVLVNIEQQASLVWAPFDGSVLPLGAIEAGWYTGAQAPCYIARARESSSVLASHRRVGWTPGASSNELVGAVAPGTVVYALDGPRSARPCEVLCALL
jgi:hypothetical protein